MLVVKSVGLNIALDPLMAINLSGCHAGLVLLVGDDPGSWGSQNEQDSRSLGLAAEIPVLEPGTVADARQALREAFALSEELHVPVMVRFTRALALAEAVLPPADLVTSSPPSYRREFMRWVVLPINAIPLHQGLLDKLATVQIRSESSPLNQVVGSGRRGVVAAGFLYQKLLDLLNGELPSTMCVLKLGAFHPLPLELATDFMRQVDSVLVLEETGPLAERALRAAAQSAALTVPICGRDSGHVPPAGELFAPQIAAALNAVWPELGLPTDGPSGRARPSRQPICDGCFYHVVFDTLGQMMDERGGREAFIVVGEPGCMVRAQLPPYQLLDGMNSLGSSVGMAAGLALSETGRQIVTLCGDSAFLHSGLNALIDAVRAGAKILLIILDNGTTALSGRQPHPASDTDPRGRPRRPVDLATLATAAGAGLVLELAVDQGDDVVAGVERGLAAAQEGVAVLVARGRCVLN